MRRGKWQLNPQQAVADAVVVTGQPAAPLTLKRGHSHGQNTDVQDGNCRSKYLNFTLAVYRASPDKSNQKPKSSGDAHSIKLMATWGRRNSKKGYERGQNGVCGVKWGFLRHNLLYKYFL